MPEYEEQSTIDLLHRAVHVITRQIERGEMSAHEAAVTLNKAIDSLIDTIAEMAALIHELGGRTPSNVIVMQPKENTNDDCA